MKSTFFLIVAAIFFVLVGFFVYQNPLIVSLRFFTWSWSLSVGFLVLLSVFLGLLVGIVWFLPRSIMREISLRNLRKNEASLRSGLDMSESQKKDLQERLTMSQKKDILVSAFLDT